MKNNTNITYSEPELTPNELVERIMQTSVALQLAWAKPKTAEVVSEIEDLGLRFRLLTEAFDALPKGGVE